jgi:hypothetical protein
MEFVDNIAIGDKITEITSYTKWKKFLSLF